MNPKRYDTRELRQAAPRDQWLSDAMERFTATAVQLFPQPVLGEGRRLKFLRSSVEGFFENLKHCK